MEETMAYAQENHWPHLMLCQKCCQLCILVKTWKQVYDIVQYDLRPEFFLVERERTQDNRINIFSVQSSSILITGTMSYPWS